MGKCFVCGQNAQSRTKEGTWLCKDCVNRLGGYGEWMKTIRKMGKEEILSSLNSTGLSSGDDGAAMTSAGEGSGGFKMICPRCGGTNVSVNTVQENLGSTNISQTKSKYKEKGHGCLWWLFIGSWWWIIDLLLWIFLFIPRALMHIGRKKKYVGKSTTVSSTMNHIVYKTICTCQSCGNAWESKN